MGCSGSVEAQPQRPITALKHHQHQSALLSTRLPLITTAAPPKTPDPRLNALVGGHAGRPTTSGGLMPIMPNGDLTASVRMKHGSNRSSVEMLKRPATQSSGTFVSVQPSTTQSVRLHTGGSRPVTGNTSLAPPSAAQQQQSDMDRSMLVSRRAKLLLTDDALDVMRASTVVDDQHHIVTAASTFNWCDPLVFTGRMQEAFAYYARPPDYETMDKKGISLLATDCVNYTYNALRHTIKQKHTSWPTDKIDREFCVLIPKYLPGRQRVETIEIVEHYLKSELRGSDGLVTRDKYFLVFDKLHTLLFSTNSITVEREQLVEKLNKSYMVRQENYMKSIKNPPPAKANKENSVVSSQRNTRRSSNRRKSQQSTSNMFDLDNSIMQSPSSMHVVTEGDEWAKKSTKRRSHKHSNVSDISTSEI